MSQTRIEEFVARDAVRAVEHTAKIERSSFPRRCAADWRVTMTDPRIADVEVTMHTAPEARSFRCQVHTEPGPE